MVVSVNVAQLLLAAPGTVREFNFSEQFGDPSDELHLCAPVEGHARLMRTSDGILVTTAHATSVKLECARCLEDVKARIDGTLEEEFLPSYDIHTGLPLAVSDEDDQPRIDEHHLIDLDEVLRQNILTSLPLQPLCEAACPGLCPTCGERLEPGHPAHTEGRAIDPASPFAQLAVLLDDNEDER
jgi:uncharacterized protein